jgi:hypothetical protein
MKLLFDRINPQLADIAKSNIKITDSNGRVLIVKPKFYLTADLKTCVHLPSWRTGLCALSVAWPQVGSGSGNGVAKEGRR